MEPDLLDRLDDKLRQIYAHIDAENVPTSNEGRQTVAVISIAQSLRSIERSLVKLTDAAGNNG